MTTHPRPSRSRKDRGMKTQALVAAYLAAHGWPFAESTGGGRSGVDVTGTPDIAVEVKARANFDPLSWVRQAKGNADGRLPFAVMRCNGQGEQTIDQWVALIPFGDLVRVLREAGYGDGDGSGNAQLRAAINRLEAVDHRPATWPKASDGRHDHPFKPSRIVVDGRQACDTCGEPHYRPATNNPKMAHAFRPDPTAVGRCQQCGLARDRHYDPADILDDGATA